MKLALVIGNRYSPWHGAVFERMAGTNITVFRADSEIQRRFDERGADNCGFPVETIRYEGEGPGLLNRLRRSYLHRIARREARLAPFHERLAGFDRILSWELFTDWTGEALEARARFGVPLSVMVWDTIPFHFDRPIARRRIRTRAKAEADRFIVYTEFSRRMLRIEGIADDRIDFAPPGVDTAHFSPGPGDRDALGIPEDAFVVAFVGWFLPRKGLDYLILAMQDLADRIDRPLHLYMTGSGPGKGRIDELLKRIEPRFGYTFAGSVRYDAMPAVYRAADAFVLPSLSTPDWQEQFGMALIEAMACGRPVIGAYSGAIPEIAGDACVLVPPADFGALSDALEDLVRSPELCEAMGEAARARAVARYDLDLAAAAMARALGPC